MSATITLLFKVADRKANPKWNKVVLVYGGDLMLARSIYKKKSCRESDKTRERRECAKNEAEAAGRRGVKKKTLNIASMKSERKKKKVARIYILQTTVLCIYLVVQKFRHSPLLLLASLRSVYTLACISALIFGLGATTEKIRGVFELERLNYEVPI